MNIGLSQVSGAVMILGSVLFLVAAFMPISARVFPETSPAKKLERISESMRAWIVSQVLFGLGSLVTVIGIGLLASDGRDGSFAWLMLISTALLMLALVPWFGHLYARAADPAAFAEGAMPAWLFLLYAALTEVGLAIFGVALLVSPYPDWLGWVVIVGMALLIVLTIVLRDMPPFFFYVVTLLAGVVILLTSPSLAP
ncbi:MFS family permease [Agromyces albus]|nr:MFS family permease [Agromyces albus]